jgi:hemin uptake protein HemP
VSALLGNEITSAAGNNSEHNNNAAVHLSMQPWYSKIRHGADQAEATKRISPLSPLRHHYAKNVIDARGIACAVLLKPFEYVGIQAHGHQFLWRTTELGKLLIGEGWNIGIVDLRSACALLALCHAI